MHEVLRNNGIGGENIIKSANRHATNAAKIIAGLFVTDPNKGFFGRALELFSRFTFQATQTMVGYMYSNIANMAGRVSRENIDLSPGLKQQSGKRLGPISDIRVKFQLRNS